MSADPAITTIAVAPALTQMATLDVRNIGKLTVQVQNLDAIQTCSVFIQRKVSQAMGFGVTPFADLTAIPPAGSLDADGNPADAVTADIDCAGTAVLLFAGRMSGAGGNVRLSYRHAGPK